MPGPVLLVLDDIALISVARRLLSREGREVILASSVADAIIAFGHYRPGVVLLSAGVEGGRGALVVDELRQHPEGHPLHLLMLGAPLSDVDAPVVGLPLEEAPLLARMREAERRPPIGGWTVREPLVPVETKRRREDGEAWKARGPRGSMAERLFGSLEGAPNDTPAPAEALSLSEVTQGSYEVTQTGVPSPFHEPAAIDETTQQTVVPEWLRASAPATRGPGDSGMISQLREDLARAQEEHAQARAMISALRLQAREAEAALRRQADSKHDASPVEVDPAELAQLKDEVARSQEDARGARRSLGRAIARQKELETELERVRAEGPGGDVAIGASQTSETAELEAARDALETRLAELQEAHRAADAERTAMASELAALREARGSALDEEREDLKRELAALTSARATQEALAAEVQRELAESLEASEAQRAALEAQLAQQAASLASLEAEAAHRDVRGSAADEAHARLGEALEASESKLRALEERLAQQGAAGQAQAQAADDARATLSLQVAELTLAQAELQGALDAERAQLAEQRLVQEEAQRELKAALESSESSRAALEAQFDEQSAEAEALGDERAKLQEALQAAEAQLGTLESEMVSLRAAAEAEAEAHDAANARAQALESSHARVAELEETLRTQEARSVEVHRRLAEALAAANARALEVESRLAARQERDAAVESEAIRELHGRLAELEALRGSLEAELAGTLDALELERAQAAPLAERVEALTRDQEHRRRQLEVLRMEHARTHAAQLSHAVALDQSQQQHAELQAAHAAALDGLETLRTELGTEANARAEAEAALEALRSDAGGEVERLTEALAMAREQFESAERGHGEALAQQNEEHEAAKTQLHDALQTLRAALGEEEAARVALTAELEQWKEAATRSSDRADATLQAQETEIARLGAELADAHARARAWQDKLAEADASLETAARELSLEKDRADAAEAALVDREALDLSAASEASAAHSAALVTIERLNAEVAALEATALAEHENLTEQLAAAQAHRLGVQEELSSAVAAMQAQKLELEEQLASAVAAEQERRLAVQEDLTSHVAASHAQRLVLEEELAEARRALEASGEEAGRLRAEQETILARAVGAVGVVVGETSEGAGGPLDRSRLISLMLELHVSRPEARLEVRTSEALRVLFFREGALVGATSTSPGETLLDRARRDGLIDGRQEAELRLLRGVSSGDLLRALRERGYLRENEVLPLVQRHTEQVALEVFSQTDALFRLSLERTPAGLVLAAAVRPPLVLLTEALRSATPSDGLLASLGGLGATVHPRAGAIGLGELGLRDPELALLRRAEVPTTVEQLLLGSGMRQEVALRTLALGRAFGLIELEPGATGADDAPEAADDLEVQRLAAKFDEVQDADYFAVLGLPRGAGGAEVRRAFELLSTEFHPMRFAGHPDPLLQRRAEAVQELLSEALQALEDDRLRAAYARNLRD